MSDPGNSEKQSDSQEPESTGPSLTLLYSLVALALIGAIVFACLIVLPFYRRVAH